MTQNVGVFTQEQARLLWLDYLSRRSGGGSNGDRGPRPMGTQPPITVVLDAALTIATHAFTGATSALATRLDWSIVNEEYTESDQQITVWNHSESQSFDPDTLGIAFWIDGHWHFFGDCAPMESR